MRPQVGAVREARLLLFNADVVATDIQLPQGAVGPQSIRQRPCALLAEAVAFEDQILQGPMA